MGLAVRLGLIAITVAFMIGIMMKFAYTNVMTNFDSADETHSAEAVEESGTPFSSNYMSMVEDMSSYLADPDYQRAESRRVEMLGLANTLTLHFEAFENRLKVETD